MEKEEHYVSHTYLSLSSSSSFSWLSSSDIGEKIRRAGEEDVIPHHH